MECDGCGAELLDIDVKCGACGAYIDAADHMVGQVVLKQYEVLDVLGSGGMSTVYLGRHKMTDQHVALKILPPQMAAHSQVKSRFLEEARALAKLDHPNIVHLYTFGEETGCVVLAMQYVRGPTWERIILGQGAMDWGAAVWIAVDVLRGLEYAHARGIVHRDMKPSNVLVREEDGMATVMDFGIAKMTTSTKLTETGQTMGTVRYMSPEQVRGLSVDLRTDIYSLGGTLYEAIVGETVFDGDTHFEIMTKHLNEPPDPPSKRGVAVPPGLERVLMKALEKDPVDRFASARDFRLALEKQLEAHSVRRTNSLLSLGHKNPQGLGDASTQTAVAQPFATTHSATHGRRRWWLTLVPLALGVALMAIFVTPMLRERSKPKQMTVQPVAPTRLWGETIKAEGVQFTGDERYTEHKLRVLTVEEIEPTRVRDVYLSAYDRFVALLRERKAANRVTTPALVIQIVPSWVMCDSSTFKEKNKHREVHKDCNKLEAYYRYGDDVVDDTVLVPNIPPQLERYLAHSASMAICLTNKIPGCHEHMRVFKQQNLAATKKGSQDEK